MTSTEPVPGVEVDFDPDTEEITIPALDAAAEAWERLADVYEAGEQCPACMWHESVIGPAGVRERQCHAFAPDTCPGVNPKSIAAAFRRQAE